MTSRPTSKTGDITTIKGEKVTFEKSRSVEVVLTFVDTSIANLKKIVPGAWLADDALITGQPAGNVVNNDDGAIALGRAGQLDDAAEAVAVRS